MELYKIYNAKDFRTLLKTINVKSEIEIYIKNDILRFAHSWELNNDLWRNADELLTHLVNKTSEEEFDRDVSEILYDQKDLRIFFHHFSFTYRILPELKLAVYANQFISDLYEKDGTALLTLKYLRKRPELKIGNNFFKGIEKTIEDNEMRPNTEVYWDCIIYLRELGFLLEDEIKYFYKYLNELPTWQIDYIANQLESEAKLDFRDLFSYAQERELDEEIRNEGRYTPNMPHDWGDPFEGLPENSPSY